MDSYHTMLALKLRRMPARWSDTFKARFLGVDDHVARPRNAWIMFRGAKQGEESGTCGEISQALSPRWRNSPNDRDHYYRMAAVEAALHRHVFADYKYRPARKNEGKKRGRLAEDTHPAALSSVESAISSSVCPPQAPPQDTYHLAADQCVQPELTTLQTHVAGSLPSPDHPQTAGTTSYDTWPPFGTEHRGGELDVQFGTLPQSFGPSTTINTMYPAPYNSLFNAGPPQDHCCSTPYPPSSYEHPQHPVGTSHMPEIWTFSTPPSDSFSSKDYWGSAPSHESIVPSNRSVFPFNESVVSSNRGIRFGENPQIPTGPPTGPCMADVGFEGLTHEIDPLGMRGSRRKWAVEPHATMTSLPTNYIARGNPSEYSFDFGNWCVFNSLASLTQALKR